MLLIVRVTGRVEAEPIQLPELSFNSAACSTIKYRAPLGRFDGMMRSIVRTPEDWPFADGFNHRCSVAWDSCFELAKKPVPASSPTDISDGTMILIS